MACEDWRAAANGRQKSAAFAYVPLTFPRFSMRAESRANAAPVALLIGL
jgi:hypothetical protein